MSIKVMSMVWDTEELAGPRLLVMLALADFASDDGTNVFPSVKLLTRKVRIGRRQTQRLLRDLEAGGWLVCVANGTGGRYRSRRYRIPLDKLKGGINAALSVTKKGGIHDAKGCHPRRERAASMTRKGDIAMTPNTSVSVLNHQRTRRKDKNPNPPSPERVGKFIEQLKVITGGNS